MIKEIILGTIRGEKHLGNNKKTQCIDYINQLEQENQQLKEQLERIIKTKTFVDANLEEEYGTDLYIKHLEKQLNQRDEVIDEAIMYIESHSRKEPPLYDYLEFNNKANLSELLKILQKYKGDNNE